MIAAFGQHPDCEATHRSQHPSGVSMGCDREMVLDLGTNTHNPLSVPWSHKSIVRADIDLSLQIMSQRLDGIRRALFLGFESLLCLDVLLESCVEQTFDSIDLLLCLI
jgi:hypothetical protein